MFGKDELAAILRFGAEELFKSSLAAPSQAGACSSSFTPGKPVLLRAARARDWQGRGWAAHSSLLAAPSQARASSLGVALRLGAR